MGSLYIERLLNFSVWREKEMGEDDGWNEQGDEWICPLNQLDICFYIAAQEPSNFAIPMRCRIAANVISFRDHHRWATTEIVNGPSGIRAELSWHPVSPTRHRLFSAKCQTRNLNSSFQAATSSIPKRQK